MHDKPFHWCAKCKRWTTTHSTDSHTGNPKDTTAANFSSLIQDFTAWHVSFDLTALFVDVWSLFALALIAVLIGFISGLCLVFPVLSAASSVVAFILQQNWSLLAPLLWICLLAAPQLLRPAGDLYFDSMPHAYRRQHGRLKKCASTRQVGSRFYSGSILHHAHSTVFAREGGETSATPRSPKRNRAAYRPIPANGHHTLGSTRLTHPRVQAANKISAYKRLRRALAKEVMMPIIWDSGASMSLSFDRNDFVGVMKPVGKLMRHQGITKGLRIEGQGHVLWPMLDTNGQLRLIKVPAFYAPNCKVRLLSTTSLLQTYSEEGIELEAHQMKLAGLASDPTRGAVIATVNPRNNLPTTTSYRYNDVELPHVLLFAINLNHDTSTNPAHPSRQSNEPASNTNLSEPENEWLHSYARLYHSAFCKIQILMKSFISKLSHPPECTENLSPGQSVFDDWFATVSSVSDTLPEIHTPELSPSFGDSVYQYPFDDDDFADALVLTAPPSLTDPDRVPHTMDQLEPTLSFRSAPASVAPLPQLIVNAGSAPATSTVPTSAPREWGPSAP